MALAPHCALELVSGIDALRFVLDEIDAEWRSDPTPLTTSMGDVGQAFAEREGALNDTDVRTVFQRIEDILHKGSDEEKDAVATGFLEAVDAVIDVSPRGRRRKREARRLRATRPFPGHAGFTHVRTRTVNTADPNP